MSRLIVERYESWGRDRFRRYQLVLDGRRCGSVGHRDREVIDVAPGNHRLQARMDHFESDVATFTVENGADVYLELRAKAVGAAGTGASSITWSTLEFRPGMAPVFPPRSEGLGRLVRALQIFALLSTTAALSFRGFGGHAQAHRAAALTAFAVMAIWTAMIVREYSRPRRPSRGRRT
ncbi:MAG TPA: hypothetical protein VIR00_18115 [Micromonosporaceae bacterium]